MHVAPAAVAASTAALAVPSIGPGAHAKSASAFFVSTASDACTIAFIVAMLSTGYCPFALSPESMTASAPS